MCLLLRSRHGSVWMKWQLTCVCMCVCILWVLERELNWDLYPRFQSNNKTALVSVQETGDGFQYNPSYHKIQRQYCQWTWRHTSHPQTFAFFTLDLQYTSQTSRLSCYVLSVMSSTYLCFCIAGMFLWVDLYSSAQIYLSNSRKPLRARMVMFVYLKKKKHFYVLPNLGLKKCSRSC